jgi:hypothetical protein
MSIRELRAILDQLRRLYGAGGAKNAEKDLRVVSAVMEGHEDRSVKEFVAETQERLATGIKRPPPKPPSVDVEKYVRELVEAGSNKAAFYPIFDQLKEDTDIKIAEADIIARQYTGYKARYKKKQTAFEDIEKVFIERARFESKMNATQ